MQPDPQIQMLEKMEQIRRELADNTAETKKLAAAFPAGDLDGHRRYHESVIEWREQRNKIVREGLAKIVHMGFIGGTGWLLYVIWQAVKVTVKQ